MTAGVGHNSGVGGIAGERLASLVERIERLNDEKKGIADDIKEVFVEAKSAGFDVKVLRKIIQLRAKEAQAVREEVEMTRLYLSALGHDFLD